MTPDAPRTEAGKRLLDKIAIPDRTAADDHIPSDAWEAAVRDDARREILAIEAEAATVHDDYQRHDDYERGWTAGMAECEEIKARAATPSLTLDASGVLHPFPPRAAAPADSLDALRDASWWTDDAMVNAGLSGDEHFIADAASSDDAARLVAVHNGVVAALRTGQRSPRNDEPKPRQEDNVNDRDAIEAAWGLIANAGGGDWTKETPEWQEAAARWRDTVLPIKAAADPKEGSKPEAEKP